jgi:hypothetical protein
MASLLMVVGSCTPHSMPLGGKPCHFVKKPPLVSPQAGGGGARGGCPGATWRGLSRAHQGRGPGRLLPPPGRRRRGARLRRETRLQLQAMRQLLHALFT